MESLTAISKPGRWGGGLFYTPGGLTVTIFYAVFAVGSVVLLIPHGGKSSQNHIPFGRSFSCNRLLGNKKSRHINAHRLGKRVDYPPLWRLVSHQCNRLWNSKSKLSFTLDLRRQFGADSEAAVFSLSIPQALSGFQPSFQSTVKTVFSCNSATRAIYIICDWTSVCQDFSWRFFWKVI